MRNPLKVMWNAVADWRIKGFCRDHDLEGEPILWGKRREWQYADHCPVYSFGVLLESTKGYTFCKAQDHFYPYRSYGKEALKDAYTHFGYSRVEEALADRPTRDADDNQTYGRWRHTMVLEPMDRQ